MAGSLRLSWQDEVQFSSNGDEIVVTGSDARIVFRPHAPEIRAALERLAPPGEDEERLVESILATATVDALARWYYHIDQFRQRGLIRRTLLANGKPLATLIPFCNTVPKQFREKATTSARDEVRQRSNSSKPQTPANQNGYVLSRFAYVRLQVSEMVVESPLAQARIILHDARLLSVLGILAKPCRISDLVQYAAESIANLTVDDIKGFLTLLRDSKFVEQVPIGAQSEVGFQDSSDSALACWEFHDLLFHSRSRRGRSDGQFGGTYRLAHGNAPSPLKPVSNQGAYALDKPDLKRLEQDDPPFALVQERRRSLRDYADAPITVGQLGEFLFRVARVKEMVEVSAPTPQEVQHFEIATRPFPSGGGLYELEFYVAVKACAGLAAGLYHYDPLNHCLGRINVACEAANALLEEAAMSAGISSDRLQVMIILTSRFERIAWKYESIAYALTLKHVGVVYQTMYLAATAMGLAPCALGCGDSDLFARVAGTDYFVETSVGEFLLGSTVPVA